MFSVLSSAKYGIKIIWCPKYHCELNPIEGFWCDLKWYVRKWNDQNYSKLNGLIIEGMEQYSRKNLNIKLWLRFWKCLELYNDNFSYQEVLHSLFGAKSSATIINHKKNKNFNNLLK